MKPFLSLLAVFAIFSSATVCRAAEPPAIAATERETLLEKSGEEVVVEGRIVRIGPSPTGAIMFMNFTNERDGFVALVYERDMAAFPDGLDHFLNQDVRVRGTINIFESRTPQLAIRSADQIEILSD